MFTAFESFWLCVDWNIMDKKIVFSCAQAALWTVTEVKHFLPQFGCFMTVTPVWIQRCLWSYAQSLKWHRRDALLFLKIIHWISNSHGTKNHQSWPELKVSALWLQFGFTDGYQIMHKAWSGIKEVPYCFSRSYVKFQGHMNKKIANFDLNLEFPDCYSSLNSQMAMKWCTKLEVS